MESELLKVRPHTASNLPHQKAPANLLLALESTFKEQNAERTPAAYFGSLLTALESTVQKERDTQFSLGDGDILPAELYLLALVGPYVSAPIIRANLNTLLSMTTGLWSHLFQHAPPLRSQLSLYQTIFHAADRLQLDSQGLRQSFNTILQLCLDSRPRVRKKAAEVIRDVVASPPSPLLRHPYAERFGDWSVNALADVNAFGNNRQKKKGSENATGTAIHLIAFLRPVLQYLPSSNLPTITSSLLTLPRLGNPYLSQSAYQLLSTLLALPDSVDDTSPRNVETSVPDLLTAVLSSTPLKTDNTLHGSWAQVLASIMTVYASSDPAGCDAELNIVWKTVFAYLESDDAVTRRETAQALASLTRCISNSLLESAINSVDSKQPVRQIVGQLSKALDSLAYARATPQVLTVIAALIVRLRYRPGGRAEPTAAELLLLPMMEKLGELRMKKGFEHKEAVDEVLRSAVSVVGPEVILRVLPLNLEPAERGKGLSPRAFLLPFLTTPHPSPLGHFISYFVPLTERMFDLQQTALSEGRESEAKVWSVLVSQIWNGLPAYCNAAPDLREALTPEFAQMLSQLLYSQPELRPPVLKALKTLVETCARPATSVEDDQLPADDIEKNKVFLRGQAESWFAVLFNIFGSIGREGQGMVGDVITAWASIADSTGMTKTCKKIVDMFKANLSTFIQKPVDGVPQCSVVATMQDILVLLVPYLPPQDAQTVFDLCLSPEVLTNKDNGVQKRAYKLLGRIVAKSDAHDSGVEVDAEKLYKKLDEVAEVTSTAAKKDRLTFFKALLPYLPSTSLHVIPSLIPEAVLGTKEPSEKARLAAFDLVVAIGYKMHTGGVVKRHKLDGMEEDDIGEASASIEEFLTMLAGGLVGATPHMISATITAVTRLIFEFKDSISEQMHAEILSTILVFLTSANREIVKSALGFVKLAIHSLPLAILRPQLPQLIPALLKWSHDHKNHFKAKVRHIFERMLRRFSWDEVYGCVGENEEAGKVLLNIKKRKEYAKRKKAQKEEEEDDDDDALAKPATGDAFEDVLYGSESELDESDKEHKEGHSRTSGKKRGALQGARLRLDDDEPLDLLQGASSRLTSSHGPRRKPGQDAEKFKTDESSGKMVIDSDSDSDDGGAAKEDVEGTAYRETLTSVDGFTRDQRGRIKFNKDTKKRRRENAELEADGDVEMADAAASVTGSASKKLKHKKSVVKIGMEFKAKRAGGDVKKGGVDPYAYMPLAQAAKGGRNKSGQRFAVIGKR